MSLGMWQQVLRRFLSKFRRSLCLAWRCSALEGIQKCLSLQVVKYRQVVFPHFLWHGKAYLKCEGGLQLEFLIYTDCIDYSGRENHLPALICLEFPRIINVSSSRVHDPTYVMFISGGNWRSYLYSWDDSWGRKVELYLHFTVFVTNLRWRWWLNIENHFHRFIVYWRNGMFSCCWGGATAAS